MSETARWFQVAVPVVDAKRAQVQMGVHFEEVFEMVVELEATTPQIQEYIVEAAAALNRLATLMKTSKEVVIQVPLEGRKEVCDALADQMVTAIGSAHMLGMDLVGALAEVNESNWSKFDENGEPIFDEHGKIKKGPNYVKPNLQPYY